MIIAGCVVCLITSFYGFVVLKRFAQLGFSNLSKWQRLDFFGNVIIIGFFDFLGFMFIINNINS